MKYSSITATYHRSYNYGASLQTYALQNALKEYGFDNQVLDFTYNHSFFPKFTTNLRILIGRMAFFAFSLFHIKELRRQKRGFDLFTKKLDMTKAYTSLEELNNDPPKAHFYLTGSDQIFTLRGDNFTVSRNMLKFGKETVPRFSFAASLADYDLSDKEKQEFKRILSRYNCISLREEDAKKYFETFMEQSFQVHLDPIFLMEPSKWKDIAIPPSFNENYLLYFQVNSNPISNDILDKLKHQSDCSIVCIQTNPLVRVKVDKVVLDASPEEFLGWIINAKKIITTSFHGTAFSILFHKEFYTITKKNSNPTRIKNLLSTFGLMDRLIDCVEKMEHVGRLDDLHIDMIINRNKIAVNNYFKRISSTLESI